MLFSKLFTLFAVFAFGLLSSRALPSPSSLATRARIARDVQDLYTILSTLRSNVALPTAELQSFTAANTTVQALQPVIAELHAAIADAVANVGAVGSNADLVSVDVSVQVTVDNLIAVLADIIIEVFNVLGYVLKLVEVLGVDIADVIVPLLKAVGELLTELVSAVLKLLGAVVADIVPTLAKDIGGVVDIVARLAVSLLTDLHITVSVSA